MGQMGKMQQSTPCSLSDCNKTLLPNPIPGPGYPLYLLFVPHKRMPLLSLTRGQTLINHYIPNRQTIITARSLSINQRDFDYTPRPTIYFWSTNSPEHCVIFPPGRSKYLPMPSKPSAITRWML